MSAIDDFLRDAGDRLARGETRRGLFGRAAAAATALGGVALLGEAPEPAEARRGAPAGCVYGRKNINVCYEPWKVVRSEPAEFLPPGYEGVAVRKGPELDAPIIYKLGDPVIIPVGSHFGAQSKRDGGVSRGCPAPGRRPLRRGFVWGYPSPDSGTHNKGGWIAHRVGHDTYSVHAPHYRHLLCGPADLDFDCRAGKNNSSKYKKRCGLAARPGSHGYRCGGSEAFSGTCLEPKVMEVGIEREPDDYGLLNDLSHERYNLKYEADGTTIFWLVPGDIVRRHCYKCTLHNPSKLCPVQFFDANSRSCCRSYSCVEVVDAKYVPAGVRGWINSSVLPGAGVVAGETVDGVRRADRGGGGDDVLSPGRGCRAGVARSASRRGGSPSWPAARPSE